MNKSRQSPALKPEKYDLVVLGSGEAGKYIAWTQAKKGMRTVLVERKYIGGSCPNIACLPSKNIIHSAKVASYFWRSAEFGINKDNCQINMAAVRDRKRKIVYCLVQMHSTISKRVERNLLLKWTLHRPKTTEVVLPNDAKRVLSGDKIVISTGSRATIEDISGLRTKSAHHIEALIWIMFPVTCWVLEADMSDWNSPAMALRRQCHNH